MLEALTHLFAAVCGQNPAHTWALGGMVLPCCQRCTGLYVGACVAAALHVCLRPKPTGRFLEMHGLFLLLMLPFGLHWLPQGPAIRAVTGVLFGFAVVTFLWLPLHSALANRPFTRRTKSLGTPVYSLAVVLTLGLLPMLGTWDARPAACLLAGLALTGATALGGLVVANIGWALAEAFRLFCRLAQGRTQP